MLDRAPRMSPSTYRRVTQVALWSLVLIVVTGAAVRLTASGLGCSSWPGCEPGELVPRGESTGHSWIEFGNRLITGVVSVSVVLAVLGSRRRSGRPRRDLVLLSWGLVAGVVGQILLGALVVKLHVHPVVVQGHFLLSGVLVANAVVLHHRAGRPDGPDGGPGRPTPLMSTTGLRLARPAVGARRAGDAGRHPGHRRRPHAGDADAERLDVAVRSVAQLHSALTWVFLLVVVALVLRMRREMVGAAATERGSLLLAVVVLQGALGYLQYFTGVPELLVALHVLGSMLMWTAVLRLLLALAEPLPVSPRVPTGVRRRVAPCPAAGHVGTPPSGWEDGAMSTTETAPLEVLDPSLEEETDVDRPWQVVVWDDPVNTMSYVVWVFRKLFGFSKEKANSLMLQVHHEGRAIVSSGPKEKAELDVFRLHEHGLWATMEKDS